MDTMDFEPLLKPLLEPLFESLFEPLFKCEDQLDMAARVYALHGKVLPGCLKKSLPEPKSPLSSF